MEAGIRYEVTGLTRSDADLAPDAILNGVGTCWDVMLSGELPNDSTYD